MIKKLFILFLLLITIIKSNAQQEAYNFPLPLGWGSEKIAFPIEFAPNIHLTGMEELRFTPGWGKSITNEYWSYAFLWFVDGNPQFNVNTLQSYLIQYFNGLYLSNLKDKTNAPENFTTVSIRDAKTGIHDQQTYEGQINTLDFLTGKHITFHVRVHVRNFSSVKHTAALFEISPQAYQQPVWSKLNEVVNEFSIVK